ncbi:putative NBD/HSP70 family sugar kinase [Microbacterium endophyticum]|uniref:Putative NBD/HSP70 family sugar kinase n=1 Tax=Microbacterium endophyticum TaxID=1526412 RepID=A0A7W4YNE7_9MICO|nr:ROK family transcriptional regulator [Microbacterium endophyticum]MBB2976509.1 putative NBD/HSP70 family sugar kinase [Microbacterium endophyticum]NIK35955.1 putative NBD/HSP70 family sugar kinase [Microbacterium endophyticum]
MGDVWSWPTLHDGQRIVLLDVLIHGERSRAELSRRTGLSRASLSRITRELLDLGFVEEGEISAPHGRGRPSEMLRVRPDSAFFIGIKLTGDMLYAVVTNLHAEIVWTEDAPLESRDAKDVVDQISTIAHRARERFTRISAIGVCLAGLVEIEHGAAVVVGSSFLGWDREPLERLVRDATGLPTAIENDVQALTLAHHWFGAGVGTRNLAVVAIGAGIGAGFVVNDELVRGSQGQPGKVGHLHVSDTGPECDRGHVGCVSAYATIPALLLNAGASTFNEVVDAAAAGSARAQGAISQAAHALGVVVATLVNVTDPEKVIVTGEALQIAEIGRDRFDRAISLSLDPVVAALELELYRFHFTDYAWGAAISAIRRVA